jgi:class 3 adenylate cyclase
MAIFLLGMWAGSILSCGQLIIAIIQVFVPIASKYNYPLDLSLRLIAMYILILSITMVFEWTRQIKDRLNSSLTQELKSLNENLQRMVEEKTDNLIRLYKTFGRYLPDEVINRMLDSPNDPSLGGEKRYITIMTSDIRGFTPLAEKHDSESVVHLLNHYFSDMVEIIHYFSGTIIEFLGDSILCIFGAPMDDEHHADHATACALQMQLAMKDVNTWGRKNNFPEIEMGVAINTGEAIVGNIGSDRVMKYNVIGNHVNLSGRIESYTTGGQVMISEYTYNALRTPVSVVRKTLVSPKGVSAPIFIMQIDAIGPPYNIMLDDDAIPLRQLEHPVKARCHHIYDKQVDAGEFEVLVTHLSRKEAKLSFLAEGAPGGNTGTYAFSMFEDLKLRMNDQDIQAKVINIEDGKTVTIRFSSSGAIPVSNT